LGCGEEYQSVDGGRRQYHDRGRKYYCAVSGKDNGPRRDEKLWQPCATVLSLANASHEYLPGVLNHGAQCRRSLRDEIGMRSYIDFHALAEEHTSSNSASNLYFLLDHSGMPGLCQKLKQGSATWLSLFEGTKEESAQAVAPILVLVGSKGRLRVSRPFLDWIGRTGTFTSTVIVFSSPLPIRVVKDRLTTRLEVKLSENMNAMLRFFDPRILEALKKNLSVEQAEVFFSPAETWLYVDREGQLVSFRSVFNISEQYVAPLILSQEQEFALIEASEVDQVLELLRKSVPQVMQALPMPDQYEVVNDAIGTARRDGIESIYMLSMYAAVIISKGKMFKDDPLWNSFLEELKADRIGFSDEVTGIDLNVRLDNPSHRICNDAER
jgi:hypothetical protein